MKWLLILRPHQYIKNLFIFLPLFFFSQITNIDLLIKTFIAFISFSISASAIYILNDYLDVKDDRKHPVKRNRPLAAGTISNKQAFLLMITCLVLGAAIMLTQSLNAFILLLSYVILNIGYCFKIKNIPILDIISVSIGFVLRLFLGAFIADIPLSNWIVIMTFLLSLFLVLAKRRDDLLHLIKNKEEMRKVIHGYNIRFIDGAMMVMASVVIVTYLLYTTSLQVAERIDSQYLYITAIFVILGVLRYLQISFVEENSGSPTTIVLKDKFMIINIFFWILSYCYLLYF